MDIGQRSANSILVCNFYAALHLHQLPPLLSADPTTTMLCNKCFLANACCDLEVEDPGICGNPQKFHQNCPRSTIIDI